MSKTSFSCLPIAAWRADSVEALERAVPEDDPFLSVEDDEAVVERLENVLVELAHPAELLGLQMQLAVETAVLDCRRNLPGDRRQQREILAVERLIARLAAESENRNRATFEDARNEVVGAGVTPELDFLGDETRGRDRIVERHGMAVVEPRDQRRGSREPRHVLREAVVANRREIADPVAVSGRQHQRHAIDQQCFHRARDKTLAQADNVEVAVQVARERDESTAVVVAVTIEHAIERVLDRFLHRMRQQHRNHRRQERDDGVVFVR